MEHRIEIDTTKCVGCSACQTDCPVKNITLHENKATILDQNCLKCGHCEAICPVGAITMFGYHDQTDASNVQTNIDTNQLLHAIKSRRSIRQFQNESISDEVIHTILEAGRYTPTAKNKQEVSYVVIQEQIQKVENLAVQLLRKAWPLAALFHKSANLVELDEHFFFKGAPLVIVIVAHGSYAKVDGSLAASNMALMAEAHGLGVLYSGFFTTAANNSRRIKKILQLKGKDKVIMTLVIGKPNVKYHRTVHKEKANILYI